MISPQRHGGTEKTLHFEGDLPAYAEPVKAVELEIGETYFAVQYLDEDLLFPTVETLILADKKHDADGAAIFCFQDLGSYKAGIPFGSADADSALFYSQSEQNLEHIFDFEHALDELIRCALRRREKNASNPK